MHERWRIAYADGTGRESNAAAEIFCQDKFNQDTSYGQYGDKNCTVVDSERLVIALALEKEDRQMVALSLDSMAAVRTIRNLAE